MDWKGAFLRKHAVKIEFSEDRPRGADDRVRESRIGYFTVTFDKHPNSEDEHGGQSSYIYPATSELYEDFLNGTLDPKEFHDY